MLRHSFAAGDFASRQQPFFFRASFGTCTIAVPFVAFVGSLVLVSDLFGFCLWLLLAQYFEDIAVWSMNSGCSALNRNS